MIMRHPISNQHCFRVIAGVLVKYVLSTGGIPIFNTIFCGKPLNSQPLNLPTKNY